MVASPLLGEAILILEIGKFAMEKIGRLMGKYAVPCIISLLVGALYNIVDQIFIANATRFLRKCRKYGAMDAVFG